MMIAVSLFYYGRTYYYEINEDAVFYEINHGASIQKGRNTMPQGGMVQIALKDVNKTLTLTQNAGMVSIQRDNGPKQQARMNQYIKLDQAGQIGLYLTRADQEVHLVELPNSGKWTVGSKNADIVIPQPFLDENHCTIVREKGVTTIIDNGGEAGIYLNGSPVREAVLRAGAVVSIHTLRIMLHENGVVFRNVGPSFRVGSKDRAAVESGVQSQDNSYRRKAIIIAASIMVAAAVLFGFLLPMWLSSPNTYQYIAGGSGFTVALKENGSVVATGKNDKSQCNVNEWDDIVSVAAGSGHTVGLKKDGTLVATGWNIHGECNVYGFKNVVAVSAGWCHTVILKENGTVAVVGDVSSHQGDVGEWTDIVAVDAGDFHTVGLRANGTVVAAGPGNNGELNVGQWTDIVAVSAGNAFTVGLKADGTVVLAGKSKNSAWPLTIAGWKDIVAISAGQYHVVGLKRDGTVVATGLAGYQTNELSVNGGRCAVGTWRDIVAISAGYAHTIGLKADGTVVAVGYLGDGATESCRVAGWKDIRTP